MGEYACEEHWGVFTTAYLGLTNLDCLEKCYIKPRFMLIIEFDELYCGSLLLSGFLI